VLVRFVVTGAVAATIAWLFASRQPRQFVVEQRPMLGAVVSLIVYAEFSALFGEPTSAIWSLAAAIWIGACSGWLLVVAFRVGDVMLSVDAAGSPTGCTSDAVDRRVWYAVFPFMAGAVLVRVVLYVLALLRG
jgi:hypothetical protein